MEAGSIYYPRKGTTDLDVKCIVFEVISMVWFSVAKKSVLFLAFFNDELWFLDFLWLISRALSAGREYNRTTGDFAE